MIYTFNTNYFTYTEFIITVTITRHTLSLDYLTRFIPHLACQAHSIITPLKKPGELVLRVLDDTIVSTGKCSFNTFAYFAPSFNPGMLERSILNSSSFQKRWLVGHGPVLRQPIEEPRIFNGLGF